MSSLQALIRQVQNGDTSAAERLLAHFGDAIRQECARYSNADQRDFSQSDLVQEVLLRVWTRIYQFKGGESEADTALALESWVRTSARSTLYNLHRDRSAQKRMPEAGLLPFDEVADEYGRNRAHQCGPSSIISNDEETQRVRSAMNQYLDDRTREIINRYVVEGQTFKEISEQMSLSYDQVRHAFQAARSELKHWLS